MSTLNHTQIAREFKEHMNEDELMNCMRCGFCLPTCPTYIQSGRKEMHSPRGRIALMKAVVDGLVVPDEELEQTLNECLGCRACEPVCPSGVNYGRLLEEARHIINRNKTYTLPVRLARRLAFSELFPHPKRLRLATGLLGAYQRSGLQSAVRKTGLLRVLPDTLATMERVLPQAPTWKAMKGRPDYFPAEGERKATVAMFAGCLMDTLFMETNGSTIRLLQLAGCDVVIPSAQGCCGALHGHAGEKDGSVALAKANIAAFEASGADTIVTNAGGCGAFLVDYGHLLENDPEWSERAHAFAAKIKDISAVLVGLEFHLNRFALPEQTITYQDSCHLRNGQKCSAEPRKLLKAIGGASYREMTDADRCCGSAGIYNLTHSELSMQHLDYKMEKVRETAATTIVTSNPGCLLQMKLGIEREGLSGSMRAVHIVDLLLEAVQYGSGAAEAAGRSAVGK